jgi:hypothetical protein
MTHHGEGHDGAQPMIAGQNRILPRKTDLAAGVLRIQFNALQERFEIRLNVYVWSSGDCFGCPNWRTHKPLLLVAGPASMRRKEKLSITRMTICFFIATPPSKVAKTPKGQLTQAELE